MKVTITHIDTACILLDINGYKIITDPTLDGAGKLYYHGFGSFSKKTGDPALHHGDLENIDLVLLSHHQHKDNLDDAGKRFVATVSKVISTKPASKVMNGVIGLDNWESHSIQDNKVPGLKITATPAQHHPNWIPEVLSGKVIGFIIEYDEQKGGVIYISGDTIYFNGIDEVARRYKVDIGIFHVGSAQFRYLTGFGQFTMDSKGLLKSVAVLNPNKIVPIHHKGWSHFKEKESDMMKILKNSSDTNARTCFLESGKPTIL